jgi:hypothetical protein
VQWDSAFEQVIDQSANAANREPEKFDVVGDGCVFRSARMAGLLLGKENRDALGGH